MAIKTLNSIPSEVHSVSDLNLTVRALIDEAISSLWIQGEISNFAAPRSGHWYFTLKDAKAQVRCCMFRGNNYQVGFMPEDGMKVFLYAKPGLYPERGEYQLVASRMQLSGDGELQRAFEFLKAKLEKEGLFDSAHKKALPKLATSVAIVTSSTGAALQDILSVIERRFPYMKVYVYPTLVQGEKAKESIVKAIRAANADKKGEVILLARGGGSLEDLWSFNEEIVARAVFDSALPIVSGVGHETDTTIVDFVADVRAPTPSAAAETITPDAQALLAIFERLETQMHTKMARELDYLFQKLDNLEKRLGDPKARVANAMAFHRQLQTRLQVAIKQGLVNAHNAHRFVDKRLKPPLLEAMVEGRQDKVLRLSKAMHQSMNLRLKSHEDALTVWMKTLHVVSPLATLDRGYSATFNEQGKVISSASACQPGETIQTRFKDGQIRSKVV